MSAILVKLCGIAKWLILKRERKCFFSRSCLECAPMHKSLFYLAWEPNAPQKSIIMTKVCYDRRLSHAIASPSVITW